MKSNYLANPSASDSPIPGKIFSNKTKRIIDIYHKLYRDYGLQGWWPILSLAGNKGFDEKGYHPGIYNVPKTKQQRFEVVIGAILTQNTSWKNVEKALQNLFREDMLDPEKIISCDNSLLSSLIKPAGYYNQKAIKLKHISKWFLERDMHISKLDYKVSKNEIIEYRNDLLSVHGVGFETADSILLYSYNLPIFVVDTYTKRLFSKEHLINVNENKRMSHKHIYHNIQELVHSAFSELNPNEKVKTFNEFHALIVEWGKNNKNSV